jgi:Subtilase family
MNQARYRALYAALSSALLAGALILVQTASARGTSAGSAWPTGASPAAATAPAAPAATSPLPAQDYHVRQVCRAPGPGQASCLAQELVPETAAARARGHPLGILRATPLAAPTPAEGAYGLRPEDLKDAYFPGEAAEAPTSEPQTIALVDAYNDLSAEADLETYGQAFGPKLPKLTACSTPKAVEPGCFEKVNQEGKTEASKLPFPKSSEELKEARELCETRSEGSESRGEWEERELACELVEEAAGWSLETSLDIQMAHATCRNCRIVLVEAESPGYEALEKAETTAVALGATEVSNSWGGEEPGKDSAAFDHQGVVITASSGDSGYLNWTEAEEAKALRLPYYAGAGYPASSPHVVAVGGTSLILDEATGAWQSETVWNDDHTLGEPNNGAGGSACSARFEAEPWQRALPDWSAVGCERRRAVADVSADGDPYTGVAVYDSQTYCEYEYREGTKRYVVRSPWCTLGGTSVSSPLVAGMFALAGGAHGVQYPAKTLYEHLETDLLHTVSGANGECDGDYASGCTGSMSRLSSRFPFDCGEGVLICNGALDCEGHYYDGPAGVGSPNGIGALEPVKPEEHLAKLARPCEPPGTGGETSGSTGAIALTATPPGAAPLAPNAAAIEPLVSALALTRRARGALSRHGHHRAVQLAFTFTLNVAVRVQVTLAERIRRRGRWRWQPLRACMLRIAAGKGHDGAHLRARRRLAPGRYRLTLTPAGGRARALTFEIR